MRLFQQTVDFELGSSSTQLIRSSRSRWTRNFIFLLRMTPHSETRPTVGFLNVHAPPTPTRKSFILHPRKEFAPFRLNEELILDALSADKLWRGAASDGARQRRAAPPLHCAVAARSTLKLRDSRATTVRFSTSYPLFDISIVGASS